MINRIQFPQVCAPYCIGFEKSVGAIVFYQSDDNVRFLVIKYRNGHWEFPRGRTENGETEEETMHREIMEETGINQTHIIPDFRLSMRFSYVAHGLEREERIRDKNCLFVHKKAVFFLVETHSDHVQLSHEHQCFDWLVHEDAIKRLTYANAKKILVKAQQRIHNMH